MKRYDFTVPENAQGTRLFPCACRMLPQVPAYALRRAFQKRDVKVDGHRVDLSAMASPGTQVCIYTDEARVKTVPVVYQDENVLVAVKPAGVSCEPDRRGGKTFPQLLCEQLGPGTAEPLLCHRLDNPTEGLLLLTNEGGLAHDILSPKHHVDKVYYARTAGCLTKEDCRAFAAGMTLGGGLECLPAGLEILSAGPEGSEGLVTLREGKFHQVKRMLAARGKPVLYLKRVRMGNLPLDPALEPGTYRYLTEDEVESLRNF